MHFLVLVVIVAIGAVLRFWNLDAKPLWMDEVITALFSLGRNYYEVPIEQVLQPSALEQLFTLKATTCADIAQTVSVQSVHPPLFFCWLHQWVQIVPGNWVWRLRSLPALAGVIAIVMIYVLNRIAFSKRAGLIGAIAMAVSPFAVYLSQEARHYTIPMLFIIMALLGLVRIQQDLQQQRVSIGVWIGWIIVNSVGFYIHYFFALAIVAQVLTLIGSQIRQPFKRSNWVAIILSTLGIGLLTLPWLPTFISHMTRSETDWLETPRSGLLSFIAPLYQLLAGWVVMTVSFPIEDPSQWIRIVSAIWMLVFAVWLAWQVFRGARQLWNDPKTHRETLTLTSFVMWVVLEFLAVVYVLGKDITQVPRYNFIYYPAVCALIGASLSNRFKSIVTAFIVGIVSSIFVVTNLVFQKPYLPDRVADNILNVDSGRPLVVMAYNDFQDIALGLSFGLTLNPKRVDFAFVSRLKGYEQFWQQLPKLNSQARSFWAIAPGLRRADFPEKLSLSGKTCTVNPKKHYRIGIPYQGYDC